MSDNKQIVEKYMDGFRESDHEKVLSCLTEDVAWELPGAFHIHGKEAFDQHIEDEGFIGRPEITVSRMVEQNDVVVAEGAARVSRADGTIMNLVFCDVFEMRDGKIRRLVSYLMAK
jgi:ketosteroid isomerase-like protein